MKNIVKYALMVCLGVLAVLSLDSCLGFSCEEKDDFQEYEDIQSISEATREFIRLDVGTIEVDTLTDGKVIVIDDDSTYNKLKLANDSCDLCLFPELDFSTNTLIGVYYALECTADGEAKVTKTDSGYQLNVKSYDIAECTFLACYNYTLGWHTVPKIDSTTEITATFGKNYRECDCQ